MRRFAVALLILGALTAMTACGGDDSAAPTQPGPTTATGSSAETGTSKPATTEPPEPGQEPGEFMTDLVRYFFFGQYGRAWAILHPAQQSEIPRSLFSECYAQAGTPGELKDVEVVEVYDEPVLVPGTSAEVDSKAITVRYTIEVAGTEGSQAQTLHAVPVDGEWRWILLPDSFEAMSQGECPPS